MPTWALSVPRPAFRVNCLLPPVFEVPAIGNNGLPSLGTSYDLTLSDALGSTLAVLVSGLSDSTFGGSALPAPLPGAPNCMALVSPDAFDATTTSAAGTATMAIDVPNSASLIGLAVFHQWAMLDANANALGIVLSNGARVSVGN